MHAQASSSCGAEFKAEIRDGAHSESPQLHSGGMEYAHANQANGPRHAYSMRSGSPLLPRLLGGLLVSVGTASQAETLDTWQWRSPLPQGNDLYALAHGNDRYVAVGDYGTILVSPDGTNWAVRSRETNETLNGVAFGGGRFVVVGESYPDYSPDVLLTSGDGLTWTNGSSGGTNGLRAVAWGNGLFVAVGFQQTASSSYDARILTSADGITWAKSSAEFNIPLNSVTWGDSCFVAVGGTNLLSSPDGVTWTGTPAPTNCTLNAVSFANGAFVAVGSAAYSWPWSPVILVSTNGRGWTLGRLDSPLEPGEALAFFTLAYGAGRFVAMGESYLGGTSASEAWASGDGVTWSRLPASLPLEWPEALLWARE
jgi:hypothetical protein